MPLAVGTKAPDFMLSTKAADGPKQIKLSDNFGKKNTLLLFFPMAFTGTCTTEMCEVSAGLNAYTGLNATVYGISGDNPFAQEAWAQKEAKDFCFRSRHWKNRMSEKFLDYRSASGLFSNRCCATAMAKKYSAKMSKRWRTGTRNLRRTRKFHSSLPASSCRISPACHWWSISPRCVAR